jgi:3-oxoadipate enol-lactonase
MPFAAINGIDLYYEIQGAGEQTIVFAHGAGGNHLSWWQQVPFFAQRYRVVTFDHRAFGQSRDTNALGAASYVDDLDQLITALGMERPILVAQSMGGRACMGYTLRRPGNVRALVMADTVLGIRDIVMGALDDEAKSAIETTRQQRALANAPTNTWALGPTFRGRNPAGAFLYQQVSDLNPPRDPAFLAAPETPVTAAELAALAVPILWLVGEEDAIMPPAMLKAAHGLTPSSKYLTVPEAGHSVYFEAPEAFNAAVHDFLRTV